MQTNHLLQSSSLSLPTNPVTTSESQSTAPLVTIKDGQLVLPNGKSYAVTKLKVGGEEINLNTPLTGAQLQAVQQFANNFFSRLSSLDLKSADLESVSIKASPQNSASVTAGYKGGQSQAETIQQASLPEVITKQFQEAFPSVNSQQSTVPSHQTSTLSLNQPISPIGKQNEGPSTPLAKNVDGQSSSIEVVIEHVLHPPYLEETGLTGKPSLEEPLTHVHIQLEGQKKTTQNNKISHSYQLDGKVMGKQEITRTDTLDQDIQFSKNMLAHFKNKLENPHLTKAERGKIETEIRHYEKALKNAESHKQDKSTWLSSNYFRDHLNESKGFDKGIDSYIAAPVNMRYQQLDIEGQKAVGFYRVGIMSDMRNGWYSLTDLKAMKKDASLIDHQIHTIEAQILKGKGGKPLSGNKLESALHAVNQLKIMKNDPTLVDFMIEDRKRVVQQQMIQLVSGQVSQNPEKVKKALSSKGTFDVAHVSLLNQKSVSIDKTGWVHDERVEMEDMKEIFDEFRGKTLIFDGTGPLIDGDKVYLPQVFEGMPNQEVKLNAYFFNLSVQGNTDNKGTQLHINQDEMKYLLKAHPELFDDYPEVKKQVLEGKKSGYDVAEDFLMALLSKGNLAVSLGCLSAKDRTGFVAERIMLRYLRPALPPNKQNHFDKKIFDPNGPAVKVVAENTPNFRVLKVNPLAKLPGFHKIENVGMAAKLALAMISSKFAKQKTATAA